MELVVSNRLRYIYCERRADGQGHVYQGTKASASVGHTWDGADYYEYWY